MTWIDDAIEQALDSVESRLENSDYPHITEGGEWVTSEDGFWTGGFWIGLLWAGYEARGDERFRATAERLMEKFALRSGEEFNHDLGMMFGPSAVRGWELTGNESYHAAAVAAAGTLAGQLNENGNFIPGWGFFGADDWSGASLVDTLMNLPLLLWASAETGDDSYRTAALLHGKTSIAHHVRPDGATHHVYHFDPSTGKPLHPGTYQGFGPLSCWARGQAWAITGCAQMAAAGAGDEFRLASERAARWYIEHLPADHIPYWDFDVAGDGEPRDASAGAIAAYGLLLLAELGTDLPAAETAEKSLRALVAEAQAPSLHPAILLHATADLPHGKGIDESTIYGDYYFVEALRTLRLAQSSRGEPSALADQAGLSVGDQTALGVSQ
jgi:unsaturated chondroitin disaccharide hydrolase